MEDLTKTNFVENSYLNTRTSGVINMLYPSFRLPVKICHVSISMTELSSTKSFLCSKRQLAKRCWKKCSKSFERIIHQQDLYLHTGEFIYMLVFLHSWDIRISKYNIILENHLKKTFLLQSHYRRELQSSKTQMRQRWRKEYHILHRLAEFFFVFHKAQTRQLSNCQKSYT